MLAVGQRPAAMPRGTMPANSSASPRRCVERAMPSARTDRLGAPSSPSRRRRWRVAAPTDGHGRRDALLRLVGDARHVDGVGDQRDGEGRRGGPDEQGAQVTGVHGVLLRRPRGATGGLSVRASVAARILSSSGWSPTSSPRASPAAVTTVRPSSGAARTQMRRRGANSEVARPRNASTANTSTNVRAGSWRRSSATNRGSVVERQGAEPVGQVDRLAGLHDERHGLAVGVQDCFMRASSSS